MHDIFKRFKCDLCGRTEYKKYLGTEQFDGGFSTNKFEPSDYIDLQIGEKYYKICLICENNMQNYINIYKAKISKSGDSNESV